MQIKICCIASIEEAQLAIEAGATTLGLVGKMPSGPGIISDEKIAEIAATVPNDIDTFLLTSETTVEGIYHHHQRTKTRTIQIVDKLPFGAHAELKKILPNINIVQVIHVQDEWALDEARQLAPFVDALLLDSGNTTAAVRELGGTGRTHNWNISEKIVRMVDIPVWLAGGLNVNNVAEAIKTVQPYGVDLCSGVRTNGKLDEVKLRSFVEACALRKD